MSAVAKTAESKDEQRGKEHPRTVRIRLLPAGKSGTGKMKFPSARDAGRLSKFWLPTAHCTMPPAGPTVPRPTYLPWHDSRDNLPNLS